jgi:hypothetical protein
VHSGPHQKSFKRVFVSWSVMVASTVGRGRREYKSTMGNGSTATPAYNGSLSSLVVVWWRAKAPGNGSGHHVW